MGHIQVYRKYGVEQFPLIQRFGCCIVNSFRLLLLGSKVTLFAKDVKRSTAAVVVDASLSRTSHTAKFFTSIYTKLDSDVLYE